MASRLSNFIILPRSIKDDYSNGQLTKNQFDILIWIWLKTNPVNGYALISYEGLRQDMRNTITYSTARKIIPSLRSKHYIYFVHRKGRRGSFPVYPIGFLLTSKTIQTEEYVKNKLLLRTQSQPMEVPDAKLRNNLSTQHHNFDSQESGGFKGISANIPRPRITTPNTDNETNPYKKSIIDTNSFLPKTYEEQQCLQIANSLGETNMKFILSCLNRYGLWEIERVWDVVQNCKNKQINNLGAYFNKTITEANKDKLSDSKKKGG